MKSRQELIEAQRRVEAVYADATREFEQIPGVVEVGIGIKEVAGELTGETVLRVYVEDKRPESELPADQVIPKEYRGIKTDVIVFREAEPEADTSRHRPVQGGTQIRADGGTLFGTICCIAKLGTDDSFVILGNHHILYSGTAKDSTEIGQPDYTESCCCTCGDIAVNVHGIRRDHLDCAIARLKSGEEHAISIRGIGNITAVADAVPGESVKKRGRTTELTTGNITNIKKDSTLTKILEIEVKKDNGNDRFSRPGDSGAALLNANDEIIGLHKSGKNGDDVPVGSFFSKSIGIQEVLDAFVADGFPITIQTGPAGGEGSSALEPVLVSGDPLASLESRLRSTTEGRRVLELYDRHHRQIVELVNRERAVTVVWHRKQGPAWLAAFARSLRQPAYRIPHAIEGVDRIDALTSLGDAFLHSAGQELQAALEEHRAEVLRLASSCDTVEELVRALPSVAKIADRTPAGVG
jgi:hypothetical protein